jgi:hypothetical protein
MNSTILPRRPARTRVTDAISMYRKDDEIAAGREARTAVGWTIRNGHMFTDDDYLDVLETFEALTADDRSELLTLRRELLAARSA